MSDDFKRTENILYKYKDFETLNKIAMAKINQLKNDISLQAISYEEKVGQTYRVSSSVGNEVLKHEEHTQKEIQKLELEIQQRNNQKERINNILELLDDEERKLIDLRYFSKPASSWVNIAHKLNQTSDNCIKKRKKIIKRITELL